MRRGEAVYELLSDVTRMGDWSPECQGGEWVDGDKAVVGAQFRGRNKRGDNEWVTPNTILVADPGHEFAWVVGAPDFQVCRWRFLLDPNGKGTTVTESFELGEEEVGFASAVLESPETERPALIDARRKQLIEDMNVTLAGLKEFLERS